MRLLKKLLKRHSNPSDVLDISVRTLSTKQLSGGQYNTFVTVRKKDTANGSPCTVVFKFETADEDTSKIRVSTLKSGDGVKVTL